MSAGKVGRFEANESHGGYGIRALPKKSFLLSVKHHTFVNVYSDNQFAIRGHPLPIVAA
jgi:hypothetical protein